MPRPAAHWSSERSPAALRIASLLAAAVLAGCGGEGESERPRADPTADPSPTAHVASDAGSGAAPPPASASEAVGDPAAKSVDEPAKTTVADAASDRRPEPAAGTATAAIEPPRIVVPPIGVPKMPRTYTNPWDDDINRTLEGVENNLNGSIRRLQDDLNEAMVEFTQPINEQLATAREQMAAYEARSAELAAIVERQRAEAKQFRATIAQQADRIASQDERFEQQDERLAGQIVRSEKTTEQLEMLIAEADAAKARLETARGWAGRLFSLLGVLSLTWLLTPIVGRLVRAALLRRGTPTPRAVA